MPHEGIFEDIDRKLAKVQQLCDNPAADQAIQEIRDTLTDLRPRIHSN